MDVDHRNPDDAKGFTATINTGDVVTAESVTFQDFDGFSGNF